MAEAAIKPKAEKVKAASKAESPKPFVIFKTFMMEETHEDLIVSVRIRPNEKIVSGFFKGKRLPVN